MQFEVATYRFHDGVLDGTGVLGNTGLAAAKTQPPVRVSERWSR